jgi:serine/threonine protein kinase
MTMPVDEGNGITSTSAPSLTVPSNYRPPSREINHVQREWDLFRLMNEIAKGMAYLHSKGVLHGDLKAANVLVDDKYRCVVSDFGQSEMKSESYRISGTSPRALNR